MLVRAGTEVRLPFYIRFTLPLYRVRTRSGRLRIRVQVKTPAYRCLARFQIYEALDYQGLCVNPSVHDV